MKVLEKSLIHGIPFLLWPWCRRLAANDFLGRNAENLLPLYATPSARATQTLQESAGPTNQSIDAIILCSHLTHVADQLSTFGPDRLSD